MINSALVVGQHVDNELTLITNCFGLQIVDFGLQIVGLLFVCFNYFWFCISVIKSYLHVSLGIANSPKEGTNKLILIACITGCL